MRRISLLLQPMITIMVLRATKINYRRHLEPRNWKLSFARRNFLLFNIFEYKLRL